jgi:hypothetical protein
VPISREQRQVDGVLPEDPSSVSHTTLPIPGITTPGEQALIDATNPSMLSTIQNYQELNAPPPVIPGPEINPAAKSESFLDKLKSVIAGFAPQGQEAADGMRREVIKELLNKPPLPETTVADTLRKISQFDQDITKGGVAGVASLPGQIARSMGGWAGTTAGQLSGSQPLTKWGVETQMSAGDAAKYWQDQYGVDPNNPTQMTAMHVGQNIGKSPAATLANLAMSSVAEKYLGPAAEYMGKNYPIPSLNPIGTANAATVFGKPPLVVNTPAGPQVMNDADVSQFVYGGAFAVGFGASFPMLAKGVKVIRNFKPLGLDGVFDPRRDIPGAPGTEAASIPLDKLKAGSIDPGKAIIDIAERQAKYELGTKTGIDPIAANEVLQAWRFQTNSGAQNLIRSALEHGEMNVPEYRFNVHTSIAKLGEYAKEKPDFIEYIRLKAINEEIRLGMARNNALPRGRAPTHRTTFEDPNTGHQFTDTNTSQVLSHLDTEHPEMAGMYLRYRDNLDATRDVISSHPTNAVENYQELTAHAIQRPTLPIFSAAKKTDKLFDRFLRGDNPLEVAEQNMRRAFEAQMSFDSIKRYINMTEQYVGDKAFTERTSEWVKNNGSKAEEVGALLTRKHNGEIVHWTADPLLVSIFNSGHVPLSGMEQMFAASKSVFQKTTTGFFAPWFAPTGMIRAMEQGWTTAPGDMRTAGGRMVLPAGPGSTVMGMLTRMGAQMSRPTAKFFSEGLGSTAWGKTLTFGQNDLIARSLEKWYMDSFYRKMQVAGAFNDNPTMEGQDIYRSVVAARKLYGQNQHMNPVIDFMEKATNTLKRFTYDPLKRTLYTPGNAFLTIMQEAPAYGWARKVGKGADDVNRPTWQSRPISDAELAVLYRNYTGDPSTRGYAYQKNGKLLNFQGGGLPNRPLNGVQTAAQHVLRATWGLQDKGVDALNVTSHAARSVTPWAGVLFQSPSATLAALRDNPIRANLAFAASAVLPEVTAYLWNSYWSTIPVPVFDDTGAPVLGPDGKQIAVKYDYVNHMMNGRNDHNLMNNIYWAVPNKKPNEGWEFRHYQEVALNRYMARAFMHQYMGKSYDHMGDDLGKAINGFLATAVIPPVPSPVGAFLGSKGLVATGGFTGGLFKSRSNAYVDLGGGESPLELTLRAIIPSITDVSLQAYQAGMSAPNWSEVPAAVGKQVGKRVLSRTAVLGDLTGYASDVTGSTSLSDELWTNKKTIDDLLYRYRVWDQNEGGISSRMASKKGAAHVSDYMDELPPGSGKDLIANPGLQQKPPKNPLYSMLMDELEKTFGKDEPSKGGMGFKSMWKHYGIYGQEVSRMRTVNEGNAGAWVEKQLENPELMQWLRERNVNPLNYKEVMDFYQGRRNKATQKILQTIKATEQRISKMPAVQQQLKGKPFKIGMVDPDEPGLKADKAAEDATE